MSLIDLYHRTTVEAARAIAQAGSFTTLENTPEAYVSTHPVGYADGYGEAVVQVRIQADLAELDDEFQNGEKHYRVPLDQAVVVAAFTFDGSGNRIPLG